MDVNLQTSGAYAATRPTTADVSVQVAPQVAVANQPVREREPSVVRETPSAQVAPITVARNEGEEANPAPGQVALRDEDISDYMIDRAFTDANRALDGGSFRLSYGIHEASNRIHVAIYDSSTNELIREVPSQSRLDLYARITEFTGLLFDSSS